MDQSCIFCKVIQKELPSHTIYENEHVYAFLDIHPTSKGHTLVVPKVHTDDFLSTSPETLLEINRATQTIARAVLGAVDAKGFNININNGSVAGQVIFHLHWHIIPRFENDGKKLWAGGSYKEGEAEAVAEKIRTQMTR